MLWIPRGGELTCLDDGPTHGRTDIGAWFDYAPAQQALTRLGHE